MKETFEIIISKSDEEQQRSLHETSWSRSEFVQIMMDHFAKADVDRNGVITFSGVYTAF